jgi:hypothetical protein
MHLQNEFCFRGGDNPCAWLAGLGSLAERVPGVIAIGRGMVFTTLVVIDDNKLKGEELRTKSALFFFWKVENVNCVASTRLL